MRRERGMVTAELATIAPFAVAFAFLLLWIVSLGLTQIRVADASREAARMVARGEAVQDARGVARRQSPSGAKVVVDSEARHRDGHRESAIPDAAALFLGRRLA